MLVDDALELTKIYRDKTKHLRKKLNLDLRALKEKVFRDTQQNIIDKFAEIDPILQEFGFSSMKDLDGRTKIGRQFCKREYPIWLKHEEKRRKIINSYQKEKQCYLDGFEQEVERIKTLLNN